MAIDQFTGRIDMAIVERLVVRPVGPVERFRDRNSLGSTEKDRDSEP